MELNLHEWGDTGAPVVVCLHGLNAHGRRFRRLAEDSLADRFRVLAPDLRCARQFRMGAALDDRTHVTTCSRRWTRPAWDARPGSAIATARG